MGLARSTMVAATLLAIAAEAAAQQPQRRAVTAQERQAARAALDRFTRPTLTRFASEAEFRLYVEAVRQVRRTSGRYYYAAGSGVQFAEAQSVAPPALSDTTRPVCPPEQPECLQEDDHVVVTGSRIPSARNPSITNNQMRGVEEGDIVKQIGHYLLVLQDGRIFVVDTRAQGTRQLALTDRANVYRNPRSDMWYDEMLVSGDRILITGYSYDEGATEMAVFRLSPAGRLAREGVFRIASNDYYSGNNYATRLIGGNLVTYTPLRVRDVADADFRWPVVRRWLAEDEAREIAFQARRARNWRARRDGPPPPGPAMIDAGRIYRPVQTLDAPVIHAVSVCPLATAGEGRGLACRTTAFVGPGRPEWYVTGRDVYLWTAPDGEEYDERCDAAPAPVAVAQSSPALVYRVPISGARPSLIAAHGMPPDQFAMQADGRNLHALVRLQRRGCSERYDEPAQLAFFSIPLARFGPTRADAPLSAFTALPGTASHQVASRFTDTHLVYGGLSRFRRGYPDFALYRDYDEDYVQRMREDLRPRPAYALPIARPALVRAIDIGHTVIRAERLGNDILLTGYRDRSGLSLTLIGLEGRPRIASSVVLAGRYESEGRSHAFNSLLAPDGSGLMGLPTVPRVADADREHWRSRASDLSFLSLDRDGRLHPIGQLERRFDYVDSYDEQTRVEDEDGVPGYRCEVSCTDWYGNSRPIFTDGRIFGLSGAELIEGRVEGGRIRELRRLNFALAPVPVR